MGFSTERKSGFSIEQMVMENPEFKGGPQAMNKFIVQNLNYPEIARKEGIEGTVEIRFCIETNGSISNISVIKALGWGMEDEAIRVIKLMPPWKPGKQNGKFIRCFYYLPIKFKLK